MFGSSEILICSAFRTYLQFWPISLPFPPLVQTPAYLLDYPNSFLTDLYISLFGPLKYFSKWNSKKSCQYRSNSVTLKPPISSHCNKKEQQISLNMAWKTLHDLRGSYQPFSEIYTYYSSLALSDSAALSQIYQTQTRPLCRACVLIVPFVWNYFTSNFK